MGSQFLKKIVLLNPEANWGGAERCLWDLVIGSKQQRLPYDFHIILGDDGPLATALNEAGISCQTLPMPAALSGLGENSVSKFQLLANCPALFGYTSKLRKAIAAAAPHLVHSNGVKTHLLSRLVVPANVPLIWHMHDFISERPFSRQALKVLSSATTALVCNSHATQWDVSSVLSHIPSQVNWNGVDTTYFSPKERVPGPLRVGLIATYAVWKGHTFFLDAVQELLKTGHNDVKFEIIGGPIYRSRRSQHQTSELQQQIENRGLQRSVQLIDFQTDVASAIHSLDIVVHASTKPEPFGRTIIEAMSCGKTIIASAEAGPVEIVQHQKDGLLYQPRSIPSLSETLERALKSEELRRKLGETARKTILEKFSTQSYITRFSQFYSEISSSRLEGSPQLRKRLTIAMGIREDQWNSMKNYALGVYDSISDKTMAKEKLGIPVFVSPSIKRVPSWIDRRIRYPMQVSESQIFHLTDHSYADSLLSARFKSEKTIVVVHDLAFWRNRTLTNSYFRNKILRGIQSADVKITDSLAIAYELKAVLGIETDAIIPPGIPDQFTHSDAVRDEYLLVHVGDTGFRKGLDRLICFMTYISPKFRLVQVGGKFTASQKSQIAYWGMENRVVEAGKLPLYQLVELYQRASALVFPSRYEGFGIPVIEARSCGTPVIISPDVPALEHLRYDPGTLILDFSAFETNDHSESKRRCLAFFNDFRRRPARFAHRNDFRWETIADRYLQVYETLV